MPDPSALALLAVLAGLVGISVGATGYGGYLLPVVMIGLLAFPAPEAVYHGLAGSLIATVAASAMHLRSHPGRPPWALIGLLCLGTLPGIALGQWLSGSADPRILRLILSVVLVAATILVIRAARAKRQTSPTDNENSHAVRGPHPLSGTVQLTPTTVSMTVLAGCLAGFTTMIAGVGGPLIVVPALVLLGLGLSTALTAAMINSLVSIVAALATMVGRLSVQPDVLGMVMLGTTVGMVAGAALHHRLPVVAVTWAVIAVSAVSAIWLFVTAALSLAA